MNFSLLEEVVERYFKVSIIISVCFLAFSKFVYILVGLPWCSSWRSKCYFCISSVYYSLVRRHLPVMSGLACCKGPTISREKKEVNVSWDPLLSLFVSFLMFKKYIFLYTDAIYFFNLCAWAIQLISGLECCKGPTVSTRKKKRKLVSHVINHCNILFVFNGSKK